MQQSKHSTFKGTTELKMIVSSFPQVSHTRLYITYTSPIHHRALIKAVRWRFYTDMPNYQIVSTPNYKINIAKYRSVTMINMINTFMYDSDVCFFNSLCARYPCFFAPWPFTTLQGVMYRYAALPCRYPLLSLYLCVCLEIVRRSIIIYVYILNRVHLHHMQE